jgi:hypothetical protein
MTPPSSTPCPQSLGALTGSRASMEPASGLHPSGFDPERRRNGCGCFGEEDCALNYGGGCRWTGGYTEDARGATA